MRAIVVKEFGAPEVMALEDLPDPVPGPGQLRVRVHAAGVNPVDTYIRSGTYRFKPPLPYTPGMDYAGVVDAVGAGVTRFANGDRVYGHDVAPGSGAYGELTLACESNVGCPNRVPLPAHISCRQIKPNVIEVLPA